MELSMASYVYMRCHANDYAHERICPDHGAFSAVGARATRSRQQVF